MAARWTSGRQWTAIGAAAAAAALLALLFARGGGPTVMETFAASGIAPTEEPRAPLYDGQPWQPAPGADGFALALENDGFALYARPDNTQIAVVDKRSGHRWTSNPPPERLARETVKGQLLANLQSPFVLTYVKTQGNDQTIREVLNAGSPGVRATMTRGGTGLQIAYEFPDQKLGFALQYELTAHGLKVRVPASGIREEGEFGMFALDLLPFFGAADPGSDGYLFVPDGPGGLIRFDAPHAAVNRGYLHQVYGPEPSNDDETQPGDRRETIAYPAFGLKDGDRAFLAVLGEGDDSAHIAAMPPGLKASFFHVYASHMYREEYLYRMSRIAAPVKAVQKERIDRDRVVEYRFLSGDDADYVGMAAAYRDYLHETGRLPERLEPAEHVPLFLKIMGGNYRIAYGRAQYVAATTFEQAADIVERLVERGVAAPKVVYYGWQNGGDRNMEKRFPIEPALGGESAARTFIERMKRLGVPVLFEDDFVWIDSHSATSGKDYAVRAIDGTAFADDGWFLAKPALTVASAVRTIDKLRALGVSGLLFNELGETVFNDYEPSGTRTRAYTKSVYSGLLAYAREALGSAGVYRGNAYTIGAANFIDGFPNDSSYDFMVDETVPFYPIALHGHVPYTFTEGNLRDDPETEFLRAIEYGALPSYFVTHDDSRKLKDTPGFRLYSSRFDKWEDRIAAEYERFDALAGVYAQRIVDHEKLGGGRFATTYEDGTRVIVDYGAKTFAVERGGGA